MSTTHNPMHSGDMVFVARLESRKNPPFTIIYTAMYKLSASKNGKTSGKNMRAAANRSMNPNITNSGLIASSYTSSYTLQVGQPPEYVLSE
jgi:hypothetical protein